MTPKEIIEGLREFNSWRRGADIEQPDPRRIGVLIDCAIQHIEKHIKEHIGDSNEMVDSTKKKETK